MMSDKYTASITTDAILSVRLDSLPRGLFQKRVRASDKSEYWEILYELVVEVKDRKLSFFVDVNGVEFGKVNATTR